MQIVIPVVMAPWSVARAGAHPLGGAVLVMPTGRLAEPLLGVPRPSLTWRSARQTAEAAVAVGEDSSGAPLAARTQQSVSHSTGPGDSAPKRGILVVDPDMAMPHPTHEPQRA